MDIPLRARRGPDSASSSKLNERESSLSKDSTTQSGFFGSSGSSSSKPAYEKLTGASRHRAKPTFIESLGGGFNVSKSEARVLAGLLLLGSVVRFYRLDRPSSVVFDEVHFGGFANKYIQSRFFMDVHPPLAKLLLTLMAWLSGFVGGSFDFKDIASEYGPANVPYVQMRSLPAAMGLALVPLAYLTLRGLQARPATALLAALLVMFDNGLITQSRFILLDSPLIFFTALTIFSWVGFSNENEVHRDRNGTIGPFSRRWWGWLTLTGLSLGAVVSCKWVGLFTIATIGVLTVVQLWSLLGDLRVPMPLWTRHFAARAVCLIGVPLLFYMSMFAIHFAILNNSGEGDGFMSSEFQHTLQGHGMEDTFADVMIGSHITIRHLHTQGGYLHSHPSNYPGGSQQQQVTLYPHRDENNEWLLLNSTINPDTPDPETFSPPIPVLDRTSIVLHHIKTNKKLHSHDVRASVTEVDYQNEVSAYGFDGFTGDANDHFMIEIDALETDTSGGKASLERLQTLRTRFRLRHLLTGCYLFSHKVKLPPWGFEQQEVTCNKNPSKDNALWFVETNTHAALPPTAKKVNYRRPGFLRKFTELQAVMWQTNAGLTDRHAYDSRPISWPLLSRGINFWVKDHRQVYLLGNPFVWWTSSLSVLAYIGVRALLILRGQRGYNDFSHSNVVFYDQLGGFLFLGWFFHYFPFFIMSRQLFLHHYFPALYFAILLSAAIFDLATTWLKPRVRLQLVGVIALITVWTYYHFSPLAYAGVWTKSQCESAKWMKNWDFSCNDFHAKLSSYAAGVTSASMPPSPESTMTLAAPVEPGRDAFKGDPRLEIRLAPTPKEDAVDGQMIPIPIAVQQKEATVALGAGGHGEKVAGAIPAVPERTDKEADAASAAVAKAIADDVPRNLQERESVAAAAVAKEVAREPVEVKESVQQKESVEVKEPVPLKEPVEMKVAVEPVAAVVAAVEEHTVPTEVVEPVAV